MFKIRMQGQFGGVGDKKLGKVVGDVWRNYGFRDGIMRGYWVSCCTRDWRFIVVWTYPVGYFPA